MRGLDPRIHPLRKKLFPKMMDCRVKPGNDGLNLASGFCGTVPTGVAVVEYAQSR
jgi:hypothetical protein